MISTMVGSGNTWGVNASHIMLRHGSKVVTCVDNVIEHILEARMFDNSLAVKNSIQKRSSIVAG